MGFDVEDAPNANEIAALLQNARERLRLWGRRTIYALLALALGCGAVSLFSDVGPWHAYWQSFGVILLLVAMALLLVFVFCLGLWMTSWFMARDLKRIWG